MMRDTINSATFDKAKKKASQGAHHVLNINRRNRKRIEDWHAARQPDDAVDLATAKLMAYVFGDEDERH